MESPKVLSCCNNAGFVKDAALFISQQDELNNDGALLDGFTGKRHAFGSDKDVGQFVIIG